MENEQPDDARGNEQPDIDSGQPAEIGRVTLILTEAGIKIELPDGAPQDPVVTMHICEMGVAGLKQMGFAQYRQMKNAGKNVVPATGNDIAVLERMMKHRRS